MESINQYQKVPLMQDKRLLLSEFNPAPFQLLPDLDVKSTWWIGSHNKPRCWYHEKLTGSDTLLLCLGDSWSWGDSLSYQDVDDEYRIKHLFGTYIAEYLNCDFLNLSRTAASNYEMYAKLKLALPVLSKKYKKIYAIITLTENGRELNFTNDAIRIPEFENDWITSLNALNNATNLENFLEGLENIIFTQFQNVLSNYNNVTTLFGRNFTYSFEKNISKLEKTHLPMTWVDVLAKYQNLNTYPTSLRFLSQQAQDPLTRYLNSQPVSFDIKSEMLPMMNKSFEAIKWLNNSNLNNKEATKHPKELGHKIWAEYLLENLK